MIEEGVQKGLWVFLANCHLMLSWMPTLEKMIEALIEGTPHPKFRLWLSSSPDPNFPICKFTTFLLLTHKLTFASIHSDSSTWNQNDNRAAERFTV